MLKVLDRINKKLPNGLFPRLVAVLGTLGEFSPNQWLNDRIRDYGVTDESEKKAPAWVSEFYQLLFIALGIIVMAFIEYPVVKKSFLWIPLIFFSYRLYDILVFTLNWIFVHEGTLRKYRRSIAGFMLNVFELALYVAIIDIICNCTSQSGNKIDLIYEHLSNIVTFSVSLPSSSVGCRIMSIGELFLAILLILVIMAGLVGGVLREETKGKDDNETK